MSAEHNQCCQQVREAGSWPRFHQCSRKSVVVREGKAYCAQHDPVKVASKQNARQQALDRKMAKQLERFHLIASAPALAE